MGQHWLDDFPARGSPGTHDILGNLLLVDRPGIALHHCQRAMASHCHDLVGASALLSEPGGNRLAQPMRRALGAGQSCLFAPDLPDVVECLIAVRLAQLVDQEGSLAVGRDIERVTQLGCDPKLKTNRLAALVLVLGGLSVPIFSVMC